MNFLSHYYFERYAPTSEQVLGGLLPDLLKNVDKSYSFQIHKYGDALFFHPKSRAIYEGWERHVMIDKLFHSSDFFYSHTHALRKDIEYIVKDLPVRASFLAHIALELVLDHLMIVNNRLNVSRLYEHLEQVDRGVLTRYLYLLGGIDENRFFKFYDRFVQSRYIANYEQLDNLPHALFNICKRVWDFSPQEVHMNELSMRLHDYKQNHLTNFEEIFTFIHDKLD